jgi:hypothetical protein
MIFDTGLNTSTELELARWVFWLGFLKICELVVEVSRFKVEWLIGDTSRVTRVDTSLDLRVLVFISACLKLLLLTKIGVYFDVSIVLNCGFRADKLSSPGSSVFLLSKYF